MIMKRYIVCFRNIILVTPVLFLFTFAGAQTYRPVKTWPVEVNNQLESFLNSTTIIQQRKVAVFDCDGTLFGQVPHYLADEALYHFAKINYEGKKDPFSKKKMKIIDQLVNGNNVGLQYVTERIEFLSGMTTGEVAQMGKNSFHAKYQQKMYPQMRELLANLKEYGFEIWVLTASPEILYQQFVHEELGIPIDRILGVKSVVRNDTVTNTIVLPVPQDDGKADAIQTFIKARPLLAAGNSRGDMEMMNESVGLKMIVNPDNQKVEKGHEAGEMNGYTVESYWKKEKAIIVHCNDVPEGDHKYISQEWGIKANKSNPVD